MTPRALIAGPLPPFRSGIADQTYRLARSLTALGVAVRTLTFETLYPRALYPGDLEAAGGSWPTDCGEIDVCLDGRKPLSFFFAAQEVGEFDPGFVLVPWWTSFFAPHLVAFVRGLCRESRRRSILYCHNLFDHESSGPKRWLATAVHRRFSRFIVQNGQLQAELGRLRPEAEILCLPHPSEPPRHRFDKAEARLRLGVDPASTVFLFSGLLREYKGWDLLLAAYRKIHGASRQTLLVLAGEPWGSARRLHASDAGEGVRLELRYLPEEERALWFSASDAVVCPYRSATGSGIAADAIAHGKPVLGTKVPGLAEVVKDGESGLLANPGDVDGLATILQRFLEPGVQNRLGEGVKELAKVFSPEAHARAVARFGGVTV